MDGMEHAYGAIKEFIDKESELAAAEALQREFAAIDRRAMAKWTDTGLASWQARYPLTSPQNRLAEYEWQRRLMEQQRTSNLWSAVIGLLGGLLATAAGVFLGHWVK
jgi:hypothetical protein